MNPCSSRKFTNRVKMIFLPPKFLTYHCSKMSTLKTHAEEKKSILIFLSASKMKEVNNFACRNWPVYEQVSRRETFSTWVTNPYRKLRIRYFHRWASFVAQWLSAGPLTTSLWVPLPCCFFIELFFSVKTFKLFFVQVFPRSPIWSPALHRRRR